MLHYVHEREPARMQANAGYYGSVYFQVLKLSLKKVCNEKNFGKNIKKLNFNQNVNHFF